MNSSANYVGYYPSYEFGNTANPGDYLSSPVLDAPEWPADNEFADAYTISPLSSSDIYTPQEVEPQNYFDRSFSNALETSSTAAPTIETSRTPSGLYQQAVLQSDWNTNWTAEITPAVPSYVPLFLVSPYFQGKGDGIDVMEVQAVYPFSTSNAYAGENSPETTFKQPWGSSTEPKRHPGSSQSKPGRRSSRIKGKGQQAPSKRHSFSSSSKGHQLLSTRMGQKVSYSENDQEARTETPTHSRTSHNIIEKQYRNRLNGQFSTPLGALPLELVGSEIEGYGRGGSGGAEKKVSKAEVLVLAKRHIEDLERKILVLEGRNCALFKDIESLKGAWVEMGGQVLPSFVWKFTRKIINRKWKAGPRSDRVLGIVSWGRTELETAISLMFIKVQLTGRSYEKRISF
jgi:hypothetical protein